MAKGWLRFLRGATAVKVEEPTPSMRIRESERGDPTVVTRLYAIMDTAIGQAEEEMEKTAEKAAEAKSVFKKPESLPNVTRHLSNPPKS